MVIGMPMPRSQRIEYPEMGHASTASLAINRFARDSSRKVVRMRSKLIKELIEKNINRGPLSQIFVAKIPHGK